MGAGASRSLPAAEVGRLPHPTRAVVSVRVSSVAAAPAATDLARVIIVSSVSSRSGPARNTPIARRYPAGSPVDAPYARFWLILIARSPNLVILRHIGGYNWARRVPRTGLQLNLTAIQSRSAYGHIPDFTPRSETQTFH